MAAFIVLEKYTVKLPEPVPEFCGVDHLYTPGPPLPWSLKVTAMGTVLSTVIKVTVAAEGLGQQVLYQTCWPQHMYPKPSPPAVMVTLSPTL